MSTLDKSNLHLKDQNEERIQRLNSQNINTQKKSVFLYFNNFLFKVIFLDLFIIFLLKMMNIYNITVFLMILD